MDALPVNSETLEGVPFLYAGFFDLLIRSIQQLPLQTKVGQARKEIGAKLFDYLKVPFDSVSKNDTVYIYFSFCRMNILYAF